MEDMSEWNYSPFWEETLRQLKQELNPQEFAMWFNVSYKASTENSITIFVPSVFCRDQLRQRYLMLIERKLQEISGRDISLEIEVNSSMRRSERNSEKKETSSFAGSPEIRVQPQKAEKEQHPNLNKIYTFKNFVISENNSFAANAAIAITKNPGLAYNPLLVYGGVGLGKTHLMQAIGNEIWNTTNLKVIYVTAEDFTNEFIIAIRKSTTNANAITDFKHKYRKTDVLLIDDIHFFQVTNSAQEELFHTFNALYESNKQIIFTCDRKPSEVKNLSDRLKTRCERGLNVDLKVPNYETRCAILFKKMEKSNVRIQDDVIHLIAKNISSNVRDLEAALTKVTAYTQLTNKKVDKDTAITLLADTFGSKKQRNVTVDLIQKKTAEYFGISLSDIKGKKRTKTVAFPRQVAMYLCREMTESSTTELGVEFGGRDHTTIIHGHQKIEDQMISEPALQTTIEELQNIIKESTGR